MLPCCRDISKAKISESVPPAKAGAACKPALSRDLGFSVLEAMVAMAILAAAFLPLLALQGQFVSVVGRLERVESRLLVRENTVTYLSSVNLSQQASGEISQGDLIVMWQAEPALPARSVRGAGGFPSRFDVTLYTVKARVERAGQPIDQFEFRSLGWRPRTGVFEGL